MLGKNSRNLGKAFFFLQGSVRTFICIELISRADKRGTSRQYLLGAADRGRDLPVQWYVKVFSLKERWPNPPKIECRLSDDPYEEEFTTEATSTATTPRSWRTSTASRQRPSDTGRSPPTFSSSPPLFRSLWSHHAHAMLFILMLSV